MFNDDGAAPLTTFLTATSTRLPLTVYCKGERTGEVSADGQDCHPDVWQERSYRYICSRAEKRSASFVSVIAHMHEQRLEKLAYLGTLLFWRVHAVSKVSS